MKNISYVMALAMSLAFACQKIEIRGNDGPEDEKHNRTLTVGVVDDARTRVGFDQNN